MVDHRPHPQRPQAGVGQHGFAQSSSPQQPGTTPGPVHPPETRGADDGLGAGSASTPVRRPPGPAFTAIPLPAAGRPVAPRRVRSPWQRLIAGLVAGVCVVVAGVITTVADRPSVHEVRAGVGTAASIAKGQTIELVRVDGGTELRGYGAAGYTSGRFVALTLRATTLGARDLVGMRCSATSGRHSWQATSSGLVTVPEPGLRATQQVIFEVAQADLADLQVSCIDSSIVYVVQSKVTFDLGLGDGVAFLQRTNHRSVQDGLVSVEAAR